MEDSDVTRRLILAALMVPAAGAGCARAQEEKAEACPEPVGHVARLLGLNAVATMDFNPDRVNIHHDEDFRITRIDYG